MTIEEEFFKTFGIEAELEEYCGTVYCINDDKYYIIPESACKNCDEFISVRVFPELTDEMLLKMICALSNKGIVFTSLDKESLKDEILSLFIKFKDNDIIQFKVKELFYGL